LVDQMLGLCVEQFPQFPFHLCASRTFLWL
jgi:hypothetical protein